jgi:hypothetical protein
MTHNEAMQEARSKAKRMKKPQIVFYHKAHWWSRKNYDVTSNVYALCNDYQVTDIVKSDGRTH